MPADPNAARTFRVRGHLFFSVLVIALIAIVATGAMSAARSSKWWWDNLGGPVAPTTRIAIKSTSPT